MGPKGRSVSDDSPVQLDFGLLVCTLVQPPAQLSRMALPFCGMAHWAQFSVHTAMEIAEQALPARRALT